MLLLQPHKHSRRAFLRRAGQLALSGTALPLALNLAAMGEAAAFGANPLDPNDYKALVCVFLYGGCDYANTVVTLDDPSYNLYSALRGGGVGQSAGGIALAKADLAATALNPAVPLADARQYALHPAMTGLASLFNAGHAAVALNVGPLVVPLTRSQYSSSNRVLYPLPPKLFSHNDQQSVWQSSSPEGSTTGWGGNLGDLALAGNSNSLFTCISVAGNAVFLSGDSALSYQVSSSGAVAINATKSKVYGSAAVQAALTALIQQPRSHVLEHEYNRVTARALGSQAQLSAALAGTSASGVAPFVEPMPAGFSGNSLAAQLKMVARLIAARSALGARRQVFLVSLGGFDLHDNLVTQQAVLLERLSKAMAGFYEATVSLGVSHQVTAFTASDFGRTLTSNGDGSDHGWGGHHLVLGGAVRGQAFYGKAPPVSVGNTAAAQDQWHVGQGRLLPSTAVDQYAATLAKWFGVSDAEMAGILPNLRHFGDGAARADYPVDLGFMA